jgi:hypothetical protein
LALEAILSLARFTRLPSWALENVGKVKSSKATNKAFFDCFANPLFRDAVFLFLLAKNVMRCVMIFNFRMQKNHQIIS